MRDFTKEELSILFKCIRISEMEYGESVDLDKVKFKIQYMIENYCEHENRVATSDENGHMLVMCGRCDCVLWHEKD